MRYISKTLGLFTHNQHFIHILATEMAKLYLPHLEEWHNKELTRLLGQPGFDEIRVCPKKLIEKLHHRGITFSHRTLAGMDDIVVELYLKGVLKAMFVFRV